MYVGYYNCFWKVKILNYIFINEKRKLKKLNTKTSNTC